MDPFPNLRGVIVSTTTSSSAKIFTENVAESSETPGWKLDESDLFDRGMRKSISFQPISALNRARYQHGHAEGKKISHKKTSNLCKSLDKHKLYPLHECLLHNHFYNFSQYLKFAHLILIILRCAWIQWL